MTPEKLEELNDLINEIITINKTLEQLELDYTSHSLFFTAIKLGLLDTEVLKEDVKIKLKQELDTLNEKFNNA